MPSCTEVIIPELVLECRKSNLIDAILVIFTSLAARCQEQGRSESPQTAALEDRLLT